MVTAISVSGPASRVTRERLPEIGRRVTETARELTDLLGGPTP
ncbi:hypothetical protein MQP27_36815 [Streptomyces sp. 7R015]|uniref:IclR-ED domain-containing protein n=1 Tax=Streptomyces cylindrosporus TaxID=2927583 RepID=A0ABS9YHC6_9ACTN|nr:hypothetical protein [Streptomyces cylindrosporus]